MKTEESLSRGIIKRIVFIALVLLIILGIGVFAGTQSVNSIKVKFSDGTELTVITSKTKVNDINCMFGKCEKICTLPNIQEWNTINITNMSYMFDGCKSLISLPDISKWNTINVNDIGCMFDGFSFFLVGMYSSNEAFFFLT